MASELLLNWLNNEIELSQSVTNFEKDFANGYLFGELLHKFNQQSNFKEFSKKKNVASNMDNFFKLQPTLAHLNVKFNTEMINAIMKEERGAALRLLYQLKMALEKVYPPTDIAVLRKTGKMGDNQPALKIANVKDQYEKKNEDLFKQRLKVLNKSQKQINMDKHLEKFHKEKERQDQDAQRHHKEIEEMKNKVKQETRSAQINKLQRNAGFMEEWQQKGVEDWKRNQTIKKEREKRTLEFEYKQAQKYNNLCMKKVDEANKEVHEGIDKFERGLMNQGINPKVKKDEAERAVSEHLQSSPLKSSSRLGAGSRFASLGKSNALQAPNTQVSKQNMMTATGGITLTSTGLKTKDKKTVTEETRKERERRRRKMIVDQGKTHSEMEEHLKEDQIRERLRRQAKQELELEYESFRTHQCKEVIVENRKLREARYEKRKELDQQTANWREEEMLKALKEQMEREMESFKSRDEEMRIVGKQAQRERRNEMGQALFDAIFDIADEAYIHQQKQDADQIDDRNWHEWLQLFIDQLQPQIQFTAQDHDQYCNDLREKIDQDLDQTELVDYLRNQGQWPTTLITENRPNLEQFLTGQATEPAPAAGGGKGKAPPKQAAADQITIEEGDTELLEKAPNNYLLGDALELLIQKNFEAREALKRHQVPDYLSLKLCFVGYAFAGKKTQAAALQEKIPGLSVYQLNELVDEAVEYCQNNKDYIEDKLKQKEQWQNEQTAQESHKEDQNDEKQEEDGENQQTNENDAKQEEPTENIADDQEVKEENSNQINANDSLSISDNSELDEQFDAEFDFYTCGQKITDLLIEGQEIPDEVYVELFVAKLRLTYPSKSKEERRRELKDKVVKEHEITKHIETLEKEIEEINSNNNGEGKRKKKRDPSVLKEEVEKLNSELDDIRQLKREGFVLIDFPSTFAQAKLLESALSGFMPDEECPQIERERQLQEAQLLVEPNVKEQPPKRLLRSGLDAVIWFDCPREECMRRALGRRYDPVNDTIYHIEDQPPITTSAPLCERLQSMDEEQQCEGTLIDKWLAFDHGKQGLQKWLIRFGINPEKENEDEFYLLNTFNANQEQSVVTEQLMKIIESILQKKYQQEQTIKSKILNKIIEKEQKEAEEQAQREEAQKKLEEEAADNGNGEEGQTAQQQEKKQPLKPEPVSKPEPGSQRIGPRPPGTDNIDDDFKPVLMEMWKELCSNYKQSMKKIFHQLRLQRERITDTLSHAQQQYLLYLQRPDAKQEKVEKFVADFNAFSDSNPDLREDDQTKEELHQKVDVLSDELWDMIEERKEQHIEERKKIMECGFIEHEQAFAVQCAQMLMQSEVDKFKSSVQLIHDYYHAFEDKLIPEAPPAVTTDLVGESEELPQVETIPEGSDSKNPDLYQYPRLDKLFEKALKTQVVPDVTQVQVSAQDNKKGGAKGGKDAKKQVEEDKQQEESQYVKEMKEAIKVEKGILRYRLTQIRNLTLKSLREMRSKALKMYQKLDDWIAVANKTENDAVDEMCGVMKTAIEEETKIQSELRIKFMDFCVDDKILNFIIPPPNKLPAMEDVREDRFNISQLSTLVEELQTIAREYGNGNPNVPDKVIIDLFIHKLENAKTLGDEGSLPKEWLSYTQYDFQDMIRSLDKYHHGQIDWKSLATFIILLKTEIPTDAQLEQYKKQFPNQQDLQILEDFINAQAWFDATEESIDREYSIPFPRVKHIKELLFKVHRQASTNESGEVEEKISIKKYFKYLKSKELTMFKRNIKIYQDIIKPSREQ